MNCYTSNIFGGLGNVLFQIAIGLSYSLSNNKQFAIYDNSFGGTTHVGNQYYFTNIFKNIKRINFNYDSEFKIVNETDQSYVDLNFNSNDNICFNGYFQSYKYFQKNIDTIRNIFNINYKSFDDKTCAIHVRRGDYLAYPNVFEQLDMDYYHSAMKEMKDDVKFLIFSNDIEWCKKQFSKFNNTEFINEIDPYRAICLMASCDYHIIANSTFSWWGAYLSKTENTVIAPYKWFKRDYLEHISKLNYDDFITNLIPPKWKIIEI